MIPQHIFLTDEDERALDAIWSEIAHDPDDDVDLDQEARDAAMLQRTQQEVLEREQGQK